MKNICIFGIGGVGGFFGGKIALALESENLPFHLTFIARGEHLTRMKAEGLVLNMEQQTGLICKPHLLTDDFNEAPIPDLLILAVKSYDLDNACLKIKQNIKPETIILPLLNGVDIYERIRKVIGTGIVLPACVYVGTHIEKPGVVTQKGGAGKILFGRDPQFPDFYPEAVIGLFNKVKILYQWFDNPYPAIWEKFIFITAYGLVGAATGSSLGGMLENESLKNQVQVIMQEIVAIASKKNVPLPENIVIDSLNKGFKFPYETKTSYQRDVETPGKKDESNIFGKAVLELGKETNIPTPVTSQVYQAVLNK